MAETSETALRGLRNAVRADIRDSNTLPQPGARRSPAERGETRVVNEKTGGEKGTKAERWDLLPMDQLAKVARLYAFGANKYADHNWRKGYDWNLSIAALYRHMAAFVNGEDFDDETKCEHLSSVVFHALALLWFMEAYPELDDRYERTPPKVEQGLRNLFSDFGDGSTGAS